MFAYKFLVHFGTIVVTMSAVEEVFVTRPHPPQHEQLFGVLRGAVLLLVVNTVFHGLLPLLTSKLISS